MGSHPANLAIRFFLELAALVAMGFWGWRQGEDMTRYVLAALVPLTAAALWGSSPCPAIRAGPGPRWLRCLARSGSDLRRHSLHLPSGRCTGWETFHSLALWQRPSLFTMLSPTIVLRGCYVPDRETSA